MGYVWKHYLCFAKKLLEDSVYTDSSTNYRVAISRAYYAAYHVASEFRKKYNLPDGKVGATHERLANAYKTMQRKDEAFQKICHRIGNNLDRLRVCRCRADYEGNWECTECTARKAVRDADTIISSVEKLESNYFPKSTQ